MGIGVRCRQLALSLRPGIRLQQLNLQHASSLYDSAVRYTMRSVSYKPWWRHQMETFSALLAICAGNSPVPGEFPAQRPVTRSFDVFIDLRLNKRLSKQSRGWRFEALPRPLWRHSNAVIFCAKTNPAIPCSYQREFRGLYLSIGYFRNKSGFYNPWNDTHFLNMWTYSFQLSWGIFHCPK